MEEIDEKLWILTNPHHFLTMNTWYVLSVNANRMKQVLNSIRQCLNHVFLLERLKNYHAQKCVERHCEPANKKVEPLFKVSSPCLDDHQFKQEELESVGELSEVCSQIVLNCLYMARIGRPDTLWSVNKLARSVTKWTQARDRRLAKLISYINNTDDFPQFCHVGNTAQHCRLGLLQDSDFAGDLRGLKINLKRDLVYFWKWNICSSQLDLNRM